MSIETTDHPVEGLRAPDQGPEGGIRETRPRLPIWDRIKFLLLLVLAWFLVVWAAMANNPILPFVDSMRIQVEESWWLLALIGVELARQLHYLISEHWSGYHLFWTNRVFGGTERFAHRRMKDWTRFRVARAIKWAIILGLVLVVLSKFLDMSPVLAIFQLPALLWQAMPLLLQVVFIMFLAVIQFVAIFWFMSRGGIDTYYPDDIKTRFTDVWGQDHVVDRLKENLVFLERPQEIEDRGGYVPSGVLLWGPPGTGKTLMAEAVAGETGKPYVFVDPGAFNNMFFGVGILKVKSLFRKLRKLALRYGGVIVFFDEADSLGSRGAISTGGFPRGMTAPAFANGHCHGMSYLSEPTRWMLAQQAMRAGVAAADPGARRNRYVMPNMGGGGGMGTLQALLTELSGLKKPRGFVNRYVRRALGMRPKPPPKYRILVMMASNLPEALDEALLRPGRIDRIYRVGYPSKPGRIRTYEGYLNKVKHQLTEDEIETLATMTPYATGATIKDTVNEALIMAIRDGRDVITWRDIIRAKQLKELGPPEDVEYIERERHAVAIHEACHAVMAYRTRKHLTIDLATIEKGGTYLGMVSSVKPEDQFTHWRAELESDILVSLASLAGERMFFEGDNSSGVSGDLEHATTTATNMESVWGMGENVATVLQKDWRSLQPGEKPEDDRAVDRGRMSQRIERNLERLLRQAAEILTQNRAEVLAVAHALESNKTITGEDVTAVIEKRPGPLVDGRPYADPVFLREIEAYHRVALVAHQNHTSIPLRLPTATYAYDYQSLGDSDWSRPALPAPVTAAAAMDGTTQAAGPGPSPNGGAPHATAPDSPAEGA